jgi:hypothetical protein
MDQKFLPKVDLPGPKRGPAKSILAGTDTSIHWKVFCFGGASAPRSPPLFSRVGFQFGCYCQQDLRSKSCLRGTSSRDHTPLRANRHIR